MQQEYKHVKVVHQTDEVVINAGTAAKPAKSPEMTADAAPQPAETAAEKPKKKKFARRETTLEDLESTGDLKKMRYGIIIAAAVLIIAAIVLFASGIRL